VNNAGFAVFGPTADFAVEKYDALFAPTFRASFFLVPHCAGDGGQGKRQHQSTSAAWQSDRPRCGAAYGATKASLAAMTRLGRGVQPQRRPGERHRPPARSIPRERQPTAPPPWEPPPCSARPRRLRKIAEVVGFLASPRASIRHRRHRRPPTAVGPRFRVKVDSRTAGRFNIGLQI